MTPTERLKQAYSLNNIPWDPALAWLPEDKQLREAEHWEERACGEMGLSLKVAAAVVEGVIRRCGGRGLRFTTQASAAIKRSERQYNG